MEREKRNRVFLLAIILVVLSVGLFLLSLIVEKEPPIINESQIFVNLTIGNENGLGIFPNETDALRFTLSSGSSASKKLAVKNNYKFRIRVDFEASGNVSNFLVFEPVVFLEPNEQKETSIATIIIPENASFGFYEGIISVKFRKAR